jgi:hypothetical protein
MNKKLLSVIFISCLTFYTSRSQTWTAMGTGLGSGTESVKAIAENPITHEIYAGGTFSGYLKKWDGSTWTTLGGGINGPVLALGFRNSELFVGGGFTQVDGTTAVHNFAKWNGTWSDIGGGFNDTVRCIYVSPTSGTIYAGGKFTLSGSTSMNHIAKLVSSTWTALGTGIGANVNAITEYNSILYAGTEMTQSALHKFDGSAWTALPDVTGGKIYALASYQNNLYVGGDFSQPAFAAAKYNGTSWGTIVTTFGVSDKIYCLYKGYNYLYIGGKFTNIGPAGYQASYVAKITTPTNPIQSVTLTSSTVNGEVYAISSTRYKPVAGGEFSSPGSNVVVTDLSINVDEINPEIISKSIYPNPVTENAIIKIASKSQFKNPTVGIFDAQSKIIYGVPTTVINNGYDIEITIDAGSLSSGNYFYVISDDGANKVTDRFLVK